MIVKRKSDYIVVTSFFDIRNVLKFVISKVSKKNQVNQDIKKTKLRNRKHREKEF